MPTQRYVATLAPRQVATELTSFQLGIGERAFLIKTPHGNIIWDLFAYIDTELVDFVRSPPKSHLEALQPTPFPSPL